MSDSTIELEQFLQNLSHPIIREKKRRGQRRWREKKKRKKNEEEAPAAERGDGFDNQWVELWQSIDEIRQSSEKGFLTEKIEREMEDGDWCERET